MRTNDTNLCAINALQKVQGDKLQNKLPIGHDPASSSSSSIGIDHIGIQTVEIDNAYATDKNLELVERHLSPLKLNSATPSTPLEPGEQVKNKYVEAFDALAGASPVGFDQLDINAPLDLSGDPIEQIQKRNGNIIGFTACSTTSTSTAFLTDFPKLSKTSASAASTSTPNFSKPAFTPP
ncbi:uncharacterized protein EAE98_004944 [Botrytis deweyae]|uniref:Ubiquitinyl hydrolase 1 n=1 Tax=Botrytis deweyae TaxID=2478750 RepID=A0ABQ7IPT0_9HELO|nr:uncharacterized protein EAE98_004944 [Botrytis deweyae]KAF7930544.1 hypothetical protein EAE98_004944 [Botrytis deweyae]